MNKAVGERIINVQGEEIILRPDFNALMKMETYTKKSVIRLLDQFTDEETMIISDACIIIWCCAMSGNDKFNKSLNAFGPELIKRDVVELVTISIEMLSFVLGGGEKKREPELQEQEKSPATN